MTHKRVHTIRVEPSASTVGAVGDPPSLKHTASLAFKNTLSRFSLLFFPGPEMDFLPPPPLDEVLYPSPLFEELGADFRAVLA